MRKAVAAGLVHVLTASGVIPAGLAFLATAEGRYEAAFAWLGLALFIDGVDGPLARRFDTKANAARFCGERLDLIVDYLTYVAVPAFMVYRSDVAPEGLRALAAALILTTSLYHFADKDSKTDDGYFVGFPAIWNLVVFYFMAIPLPQPAAFGVIVLLALLTFVPWKWLHPVRVARLRPVTFVAMACWAAAAILVLASGFPAAPWPAAALVICGAYALAISGARSFRTFTAQ